MPTNTGVTVVVINLFYRLKWDAGIDEPLGIEQLSRCHLKFLRPQIDAQ